jgi:hypothetical protein
LDHDRRVTARTADDPAIALLDAWATVTDVLTFYQEQIVTFRKNFTHTLSRTERDARQRAGCWGSEEQRFCL